MTDDLHYAAVLLAVFLITFALVAVFAFQFRKPTKILDRRSPPAERRQQLLRQLGSVRSRLLSLYRLLAFILVGGMAVLTIVFFIESNPNDGTRLMAIVAGVMTILLAIHLQKQHRRFHRSGADLADATALQSDFRANLERKIGAALLDGAKLEWTIAPTEVHRLDEPTLEKARTMAAEGRPIEEICRMADPAYDQWNEFHRRAFENLLRAAIAHSG